MIFIKQFMKLLITGCAGFIGFHISKDLLKKSNISLIGLDNLNNYYDIKLKKNRLNILKKIKKFQFIKLDISNYNLLRKLFKKHKFSHILHLAAQAGVRYSIENPDAYKKSNIDGFYNILKLSNEFKIKHLVFASTSSVYGDTKKFPIDENQIITKPESFYAATKVCNEVMAFSFSKIYNLKCSAIRFFTVFGSMGRPDMALHKFVKNILNNKSIQVFNNGKHIRDFTYIENIKKIILSIINDKNKKELFSVYNLGSGQPKTLKYFISTISTILNKKPKITTLPLQKGDVIKTHANVDKIRKKFNYKLKYSFQTGIDEFIKWYKKYYVK